VCGGGLLISTQPCDSATRPSLRHLQTVGIAGGVVLLVVRAPNCPGVLTCDGIVLRDCRPPACSEAVKDLGFSVWPGERYVDTVTRAEFLCVRGGTGTLAFNGREIVPRRPAIVPRGPAPGLPG
jgi:hypothetical protein